MTKNVHHYSQIVHFSDVDVGGVLYHPRYLDYLDRARLSALKDNGLSYGEFIQLGYALVVAEVQIKYLRPAFFEENLHIYSSISEVKDRILIVNQVISKQVLKTEIQNIDEIENQVTNARITLVCINLKDKKSCKFPEKIFSSLI